MSFFAVLLALFIEQVKPLPRLNRLRPMLHGWMSWVAQNFNAGKPRHARVVWLIAVLVPAALLAAGYHALNHFSALLALALDVGVLYLTLGFRQFSHHFTDIRDALDRGDEIEAKRLVAQWQGVEASELPRSEILRLVIEQSLLAAHRHVFGVFFWFVVLSAVGLGPAGAVVYRLSETAWRWSTRLTQGPQGLGQEVLHEWNQLMFSRVDHVPARLTAFGFAVVGNFEESVNGWRRDATLWQHSNEGIILAAAAGAVGVQLGGQGPQESAAQGSTPGVPPQMAHLQSMVGLVWRSVVLWILLVALLSLANVLG